MRILFGPLVWMGLSVMLFISIITGCIYRSQENSPPPILSITSRDLLLDAQSFPDGWEVGSCGKDCDRSEDDTYASRSFYVPNVAGQVIQDVFRLGSIHDAKVKFQTYREAEFRKSMTRSPSSEFLPPPDVTYRSSLADEYYLGCGVDVTPSCKVVARYENFFIFMYIDVDNGTGEGLTLAQIEPILRTLDEDIANAIGKS